MTGVQVLAVIILVAAAAPVGMVEPQHAHGPATHNQPKLVSNQTGHNPTRLAAAAKTKGLPKDVFPDQLARVPLVKREDLNEAGKKAYDSLDADDYREEVGLWSGAGIKLHVPGLSEDSTNRFLRKTALRDMEYGLATLVVSRELNSQVMWTAHEPPAIKRGVSLEAIDAVKFGKPITGLREREAAIIQFGRELYRNDKVSAETFARAEKEFGRQGVVLLTTIMAYRTGTPLLFRAFDQQLNPELKPLLAMDNGSRPKRAAPTGQAALPPTGAALPKDVYPDSYCRVPLAKREDLTTDGERKIYDALDAVAREGRVGLRGPAGIKFHVPGLADVSEGNSFFRKTELGGKEYELVILVMAREMNAQVVWTAHEPEALEKGVSQQAVDIVKFRKPIKNLPEREAALIQFGRELLQQDKVSSSTYARAEKIFGRQGMVILTSMFAQRIGTALFARAFDQHLNPTKPALLPVP